MATTVTGETQMESAALAAIMMELRVTAETATDVIAMAAIPMELVATAAEQTVKNLMAHV